MINKKIGALNVSAVSNKKGAAIAVNTIIILVLAVAVLVIVVLLLTGVIGDFSIFTKSTNNVDRVRTQCESLCFFRSDFSFCNDADVVIEEGSDRYEGTCYALSDDPDYEGVLKNGKEVPEGEKEAFKEKMRLFKIARCYEFECLGGSS